MFPSQLGTYANPLASTGLAAMPPSVKKDHASCTCTTGPWKVCPSRTALSRAGSCRYADQLEVSAAQDALAPKAQTNVTITIHTRPMPDLPCVCRTLHADYCQ